jgi:hypothetical protein
MDKAIFKYNGGLGALLCSNCRVIIKIGSSFNDEDIKAIKGEVDMPPQYCKQCKPNSMEPKEKASVLVLKFMTKVISMNIGKQCALIAVDEIKEQLISNLSNDVSSIHAIYWDKVKQEIEKL